MDKGKVGDIVDAKGVPDSGVDPGKVVRCDDTHAMVRWSNGRESYRWSWEGLDLITSAPVVPAATIGLTVDETRTIVKWVDHRNRLGLGPDVRGDGPITARLRAFIKSQEKARKAEELREKIAGLQEDLRKLEAEK